MDSTKLLFTCISTVAISLLAAYMAESVIPVPEKESTLDQVKNTAMQFRDKLGIPNTDQVKNTAMAWKAKLGNYLHVPQQGGGSGVNNVICADS